jgi:predicted signal transduction protein with EAL and GGDEF domain
MPDVQEEKDIRRLAAKITAAVSNGGPAGLEEVKMSCSVGISIYPTQATTSEELFSRADAAMYQAKHKGGGRFEVFNEATPAFQPQFVPAGKRVSGMRAAAVMPQSTIHQTSVPEA